MEAYRSKRACPKCGGSKTQDKYWAGNAHVRNWEWGQVRLVEDECIVRQCERCDYVWQEMVLDSQQILGNALTKPRDSE